MPLQDECVGAGILEHRWQGHTGFRTRVEIMPETTTVAMLVSGDGGPRGGGAVHAGAYILAGSGAQEVALAPGAAGTSATINRLGGSDRFHVELEAKSVCPAFVVLALRWANGYAMGLRLPFPAVGGLFRSPDGDVLPYSAASSLAALPGMGAEAIAVGAGPPPRLLGQLFAYDSGRMTDDGPQLAESLEPAGQGRFQLDLGRVQKRVSLLLSVSDDASAAVELWIEVPGEPPGPRRKLLVTRYGAEIVQRPDGTFGIESRSGATPYTAADLEHGEVKLAAFPLDRPVERTELARHGESWSTPEECLPAGEWLVQGWFRGRPDFRPLRVSVAAGTRTATAAAPDEAPAQTAEGSGGEAPPLSLAATGLLRPGKVRRARLDDVLRTIATDATAGQWRELWPLLDGAGDLYPSAFDLFKRLSRTPEAAAMSLVLCCPGRFERLWDVLEAAPLCWAAVPVRTWMSALRRVVEAMQAELVVAELDVAARGGPLASSIATFLEWAPRRLAGLQVVADLARQELLGESPANSPLQIARHDFGRQILLQRLEESRQELIRSPAHDSAHWPTWRGLETARRGLGELPASLRGLWLSPHVGWRKSVLWAPQLAAMASALGADLSRDTVFHIHQLQEFDPSWFETAHATTLVLATAALLEEMPDRLRG
ncbi:MAG: hypothetical protein HYV63_10285 [Candidatus Schekmanbacteria bacterium]|nr:hypothetical protein [Candidatus Schekmanbacteria bacterium]